jgi:magnesium transporter
MVKTVEKAISTLGSGRLRKRRVYPERAIKSGLPPGTLFYIGEKNESAVKLSQIVYDDSACHEDKTISIEQLQAPSNTASTITWLNVQGIHDVHAVEKIGEKFHLHPLMLEDVLNTTGRAKVDEYDNYLYVVLKILFFNRESKEVESKQISVVLGDHFVITFQEGDGWDHLDPLRLRILENKGRIRRLGADYLAYAIIDTIVDNYFVVLEGIGSEIERLEEELLIRPDQQTLSQIHHARWETIYMRRAIWPVREVVATLEKIESHLFRPTTHLFLRDLYDHTIQVLETLENFHDMTAGILDIYLSQMSYKLNEVMKVLTIISTIFIPLTFIVGLYGMNFKYMPELEWAWGYPLVWGVMIAVGIGMLIYFRKRKWI